MTSALTWPLIISGRFYRRFRPYRPPFTHGHSGTILKLNLLAISPVEIAFLPLRYRNGSDHLGSDYNDMLYWGFVYVLAATFL